MQAVSPPALTAPADDSATIEVVGTRPDQAQKIDRRIYRVKDNPHAAQSDSLQLLRGLPAIVVTPDDQLLLLGSNGVTVLVDDHSVPGDITQYLRTLHGSDIERIEVITNPSAQYAAQGSGGIINLVLRKKRADGASGSASLLASSIGRSEANASGKLKRGKWTYQLRGDVTHGHYAPLTFRTLRSVESAGLTSINRSAGATSKDITAASIGGTIIHDFSLKTSLTTQYSTGFSHYGKTTATDYVGLTPDFRSFTEAQQNRTGYSFRNLTFTLDHKGKTDAETVKATLDYFRVSSRPLSTARYDNGGGYDSDMTATFGGFSGQLDWVHPIGKTRILSLGARADHYTSRRGALLSFLGAGGTALSASDDSFATADTTLAAYATYQLVTGKWTLLPGLRLERFARTLTSPGRPTVVIDHVGLFPTFHLDRPLGKEVTLAFSYARRVDRPDPTQLRPYAMLVGALAFQRGNPALRDQTNDSYELNLHYSHKKLDLGAILYDRETSNLFDSSYAVDAAGNSISTPINSGHKSDRGAEVDLSLPLMRRVKGSANLNLFNSIVPFAPLSGGTRFSQFRYTANTTLEWQGKDGKTRPGDIAQLQLVYESASRTFQYRNSATASANLSLTHSLSRTLALTGSLNGIGAGHNRHQLIAPTVQDDYAERVRQPEVKLKLVRTFGPKR